MKITSFKELLLKKAEGDSSLQTLIKMTKDSFFSEHIVEILEKMAEDKRRPRSSNRAVQHFGDYSLDSTGDMSNMVHDALSHHASHYKAALNSDQQHLAGQHMKDIHKIMHFSRKLGHDGVTDHGGGKLKVEAIDPKPWERSGYPKEHEGKNKKFVTDTKGWSRDSGNYDYMQSNPHDHYSKETQGHGHTGAYPLEEMKVNGKHLHIDDGVEAKGYVGHEFDEHPIMKSGLYKKSPKNVDENTYNQYLSDLDAYEDSDHINKYYDRHEGLQEKDPEGYANRGLNKPDKLIKDPAKEEKKEEADIETAEPKEEPKVNNTLDELHSELTDEERNHPENKKLLEAIGSGAFNLDKDTALSIIRGKGNIEKSLNDIKESLSKNSDFLKENPSLLISIKERLLKATDDDADKWLQDNDSDYAEDKSSDEDDYDDDGASETYGEKEFSNLFDEQDEDGDFDDEDRHMVEAEEPEYVDVESDGKKKPEEVKEEAPVIDEAPQKDKKRMSYYADWKPREDYTPEQQEKINGFVGEGYNAGDAEILAGAHKKHTTIKDAVQHKVHPHEMSDIMHEKLKGLADLHMNDIISGEYSIADPAVNPQKATAGTIKNYNDLMQDFRDKKEEFYGSDEVKDMSPRDRRKAFKEWKKDYHTENPEHEEALKQEWKQHGETDTKNLEERKKKLDEDKEAIAGAGQINTEGISSLSAGSAKMAGQGEEGGTTAGAYQSAGFSTGEEGKSTGGTTFKDPYTTFAEKNPEYAKQLKTKLETNLPDEAKTRLKRINMHKD